MQRKMNGYDSTKQFFPYKPDSIKSFRIPQSTFSSYRVSLIEPLFLFGKWIHTLFISSQGFIATDLLQFPFIISENVTVISVFGSNTTNRFVGDVHVEQTTNKTIGRMALSDVRDLKPFSPITHLTIITWVNVGYITNGLLRNTFQTVIASNIKELFAINRYGHLGIEYGHVSYIVGNCFDGKSIKIVSSESLSNKTVVLSISAPCAHVVSV